MNNQQSRWLALKDRWYQPVMVGLSIIVIAFGVYVAAVAWFSLSALDKVGGDLDLYLNATRRWIDGGSFYLHHQLLGPYEITDGDILYPPSSVALFIPFLILPHVLFWMIPLGIVTVTVVRYRPRPWTWPLIVLCLAFIPTMVKIVFGNPFMWAAAAVALGTAYGWPALLVLVKPSLAPFALAGVGHRSWWVGLVILAVCVGLTFILLTPMWRDYLAVMANSRNGAGLLYSYTDVPLMLIPLIAYVGRTRDWSGLRRSVAVAG